MTVQRQEIIDVLRPLAEAADYFDGKGGAYDGVLLWGASGSMPRQISVANARRARSLLHRLYAEGEDQGCSTADGKIVVRMSATKQELLDALNQEGGGCHRTLGETRAVHVAPPASGDVSGRAKIADALVAEYLDELREQAGWFTVKIEHALAFERSAGIREGLERAIAVLPGGQSCDPQQVADAIRSLINEAKP